jgi:hypothetical protein
MVREPGSGHSQSDRRRLEPNARSGSYSGRLICFPPQKMTVAARPLPLTGLPLTYTTTRRDWEPPNLMAPHWKA